MRLGVIAIARPTFDVPFAQETAAAALANLRSTEHEIVGTADLAMDVGTVADRSDALEAEGIEALVVLQASFADSSLAVAATRGPAPAILWAFPEARTGGRLRLNSFCGINLAAFTLTKKGRQYGWILGAPDMSGLPAELTRALAPTLSNAEVHEVSVSSRAMEKAREVARRLSETVIGRVGDGPDGFEPCAYEADVLAEVLGVTVDEVPLPELFSRSTAATSAEVAAVRRTAAENLSGLDGVDQGALDRSLRMNVGLRSLIAERGWSGVATRCWPETFTEFGGAACTPMSLLNDQHTPGSCEADVYGNITGLVLQWLAGSPSFVADLVDLDEASDTGVMWHCGLAPFEMAGIDTEPRATIHSNRKMPLLSEFALKPGRVTIARFSQSKGQHRLVIGGGEMLDEPLAFSGTAGVIRFDRSANEVLRVVMSEGLEHHYGIVYGDFRDELTALAVQLGLSIVEV